MRHLSALLFAVGLGFTSHAFAVAGEAWLLTADELSRLTRREQKEYLREVQKTVGVLAERSEYFASLTTPTRNVAQETMTFTAEQVQLSLEQATKWRGEKKAAFQYYHPARADQFREEATNSMNWTIFTRMQLNTLPDDDPKKKDLSKKVQELEKYYLTKKADFKKSFDKAGTLDKTFANMEKASKGEAGPNDDILPNALVEHKTRQTIVAFAPRAPANKVEPPAPITPQVPAKPEIAVPAETQVNPPRDPVLVGYRCMYAGFVIKKDPCRPPNELPDDTLLKGLVGAYFRCGKEQTLCNPLLFGVKKNCALKQDTPDADARKCLEESHGVCVNTSKYATRDCATAGGSDESLDSAIAMLKANPQAWDEYLTSFYELCDDHMIAYNGFVTKKDGRPREVPEKVRADVDQTCGFARDQLKKISDRYRPNDIIKRPSKKAAPQNQPADGPATKGEK